MTQRPHCTKSKALSEPDPPSDPNLDSASLGARLLWLTTAPGGNPEGSQLIVSTSIETSIEAWDFDFSPHAPRDPQALKFVLLSSKCLPAENSFRALVSQAPGFLSLLGSLPSTRASAFKNNSSELCPKISYYFELSGVSKYPRGSCYGGWKNASSLQSLPFLLKPQFPQL